MKRLRKNLLILFALLFAASGAAYAEEATTTASPGAENPAAPAPKEELIPPELTGFVEAEYPASAQALGITGEVILEFVVDETGAVIDPAVIKPAGHGFDEAALEAVKKFHFKPATVVGRADSPEPVAVPVKITYSYTFVLKEKVKTVPLVPAGETATVSTPEQEYPATCAAPNFAGNVRERGTRKAIGNATVYLPDLKREAVADDKGHFFFCEIPATPLMVSIPVVGYKPFFSSEYIKPGEAIEANYYLERTSYSQYEVTIYGKRPQKEITRRTLSVEEIEKIPGTQGDALKVVQNLPGVARAPAMSGLIVLRGADPEDSNFYIEGVGIPILYHFGGMKAVVNTDIIKSVDVYPSNYGVRYGRAKGGVVDIQTRPGSSEGWHGNVDISMIDAAAMIEGPLGENGSVIGAVRRSYFDFMLNLLVPDSVPMNFVVAPYYYDYQLRLDYRLGKDHEFMFFVLGDDDIMKMLYDDPTGEINMKMNMGFQNFIPRWLWKINDRLTLETSPAIQRYWSSFLVQGFSDMYYYSEEAVQLYYREALTMAILDNLKLTVGGIFYWYSDDVAVRSPQPPKEGEVATPGNMETIEFSDTFNGQPWSAYAEAEYRLIKSLLLIPGVRVDYHPLVEQTTVDPRITTRYSLTDDLTFKGGVGMFHQAPLGDEAVEGFGNPNLKTEQALQYAAGGEYNINELLSFDATGFYKDLDNLVVRSDRMIERDGEMVSENYSNEGSGRIYGAEFMLRQLPGQGFFGWISYTISRSERWDTETQNWRPFDYDQTHIFTMLATFDMGYNIELGGRFRYVTGNPYTPAVDSTFDVDKVSYIQHIGAVNSERMPDFHQLDIRVDKTMVFDRLTVNFYLDVQNVYWRGNVEGVVTNYDSREHNWFRFLPFMLPIFGIKVKY